MESVLAKQNEKPHVLNKAQLTDLLEDDNDVALFDVLDDKRGDADDSPNTSVSQRSEPTAQEIHMVVDPDVMEYVTTRSLYDQLQVALATRSCEIKWKLNGKTAILSYSGEDESWSWNCVEEVQTWLARITRKDVEVKKDSWEAVKAQLPGIRSCFGVEPPLVKMIDDSFVVRIVSLSSNAEDFRGKLKAKLEEIYQEETRKTYMKKTVKASVEHLTLLDKTRFVEKIKEKNNKLEIKIDTEAEEIFFEGPQPQFLKATKKFHAKISGIIKKKLSLSKNILEVLSLDKGLQKVQCELENDNVEAAVFVIDNEARIIGTSAAHADKAASLVSNLTLEEKVRVDANSQHLLKTPEWRQLCEQLNADSLVRVHWHKKNNDIYVAGFREDVREMIKTLTSYLKDNCIREVQFKCPSKLHRKYLSELRQDELRLIEDKFQEYHIKIQTGKDDDAFVIRGHEKGIKLAKSNMEALAVNTYSDSLNLKQPGLQKYFASGKGDSLVKEVQENHACAIHVQKQDDMRTPYEEATLKSNLSNNKDDDGTIKKKDHEESSVSMHPADAYILVTKSGHKISWKRGTIQTQQVC